MQGDGQDTTETKCKEQTQAHMMKQQDLDQWRLGRGQFLLYA